MSTNAYEDVKSILLGGDDAARIALARARETPPEVLYFLAEHGAVAVRRAVAENPSTPAQADSMLSRDANVSVRCALARKAVGDGLDREARRNLWRMGFTVLETLMRDQLVRVRSVLSEALCAERDAPHGVIVGLARDPEEVVAAPVLRHSPVLTDDDMLAIIGEGAPGWARDAMAERPAISAALSGALAEDASSGRLVRIVANPNAQIDEPVMERIVERAADAPELQEPLVERPGLSAGVLVRLAQVVARPLLGALRKRGEKDPATAQRLAAAIEQRAAEEPPRPARRTGSPRPAPNPRPAPECAPPSDEAIALALDSGQAEYVIESLAQRAGFPVDRVRRMIAAKSARTVVALAWKAGLGARFALDLQRQLARIQPANLIHARNGTDFALKPEEMKQALSLFA